MLLNLKWKRRSLDIQKFRVYIRKTYEREEDFINKKFYEIYSYEKSSAEEIIYFLVRLFHSLSFLFSFLTVKLFLDMKYKEYRIARAIIFIERCQYLGVELVLFTEIFS